MHGKFNVKTPAEYFAYYTSDIMLRNAEYSGVADMLVSENSEKDFSRHV
jgi:hypothetical protein